MPPLLSPRIPINMEEGSELVEVPKGATNVAAATYLRRRQDSRGVLQNSPSVYRGPERFRTRTNEVHRATPSEDAEATDDDSLDDESAKAKKAESKRHEDKKAKRALEVLRVLS
ncbi:hypothetical protein BC938DRAFT_482325 [Jimgerdemannia flammicorona]|uniref:Uncharacterized protein n=1 Tax=Jimgerdemannia flammicorona TaxID=994334 RepID=A0A433QWF7_9FUNG|nr:hypothetical protein BC938DRAFT_482325 [Jimgerdemannia flammicorona]